MRQKIKCAIIAHFIFIAASRTFFECLPSFLPLIPGFIEIIVVTVLVEVLRVIIVLSKTVAAAMASVGAAAAVVECLGRLRFLLLLLLGKASGALCVELLLLGNFLRQRIPERGDLLSKFTVTMPTPSISG